jgi:RNA polymerase sigma-70 factor (ECF subfamily)
MQQVRSDSDETRALLEKIRDGHDEFEQLFERHRAVLRRVIDLRLDSRMRSRLDASDIIQETQIEAFRRLPDYLERRPMPFGLWLRRTACERLIMHRRQHIHSSKRSVRRELPLPDHSSALLARKLIASGPSPSQVFNEQERCAQVRQAVARLPEIDREVLLMRHFEGLSYREIGYVLEIEPAAARKRNGRALLRLHAELSQTGFRESEE